MASAGSGERCRRACRVLGGLASVAVALVVTPVVARATELYTVEPCRLLDTRNPVGSLGGPALAPGQARPFAAGGRCGVSSGATAVVANVTIVAPAAAGHLSFGPAGAAVPASSTINFRAGQVRANNSVLALGAAGGLQVLATTGGRVDVIVDVAGYFADPAEESGAAAPPAFDPPPGSFEAAQEVTIGSSTPGALVRYTTDGSLPTPTHGAAYGGPVTIEANTTLRAIAYAAGGGLANSRVATGTYTIVERPLLLLATLTPQGGAVSLGSGSASLQLAGDNSSGVYRDSFRNLSSPLTGAHIHAPDGTILFDLDTTPPASDGSRVWTITAAGAWTKPQIVAALRAGECYVNLHTSNYPSGEIKGNLRPASGSTTFTPPPPPPALPPGPPSAADAARFLLQASYGPTLQDITAVQQRGYDGWITSQIVQTESSHLAYVDRLPGEDLPSWEARESIWSQAILGPDQLRQRVALALSEIFVVSDRDDDLAGVEGIAAYMDILSRNAFGSFRVLLEEVTLSPSMGVYLDMLGNDREDPETGRKANENFARELLQLFSIGLYRLHPDGTLQLDAGGLPIATYDQEVVEGYARVFTGWTFAAQDRSEEWRFYWPVPRFRQPMEVWDEHHSEGPKEILDGVVIPAGLSPAQDLDRALDAVFAHPNVGPFICRQLIQRLVTSNPSPAYVYRCGRTFANNGWGVRGDLGAVVRSILLDWEARSPDLLAQPGFGKVREPVVRFVTLLRALGARPPADGRFRYYWIGSAEWGLNQAPLSAPTVFNFFDPSYAQPGAIADAGLVSPELQITNETSVFGTANYLHWVLFDGGADDNTNITLDWSYLTSAANDAQLLDRVTLLFYGGRLSSQTRTILAQALADPDFPTDPVYRAQTLVWLVALSPEFVAAF
jgi:uncharacterized protein (DUF1800 family)